MRNACYSLCLLALSLALFPPFLHAETDLIPVQCRALDTRVSGSGPALVGGEPREVTVRGGCVPSSAVSILTNITVIFPTYSGHLKGYATSQQSAVILAWDTLTDVTTGTMLIEMADQSESYDFQLLSSTSTHVVVDIIGYTVEVGEPLTVVAGEVTASYQDSSCPTTLCPIRWIDIGPYDIRVRCEEPRIFPSVCEEATVGDCVVATGFVTIEGGSPVVNAHDLDEVVCP